MPDMKWSVDNVLQRPLPLPTFRWEKDKEGLLAAYDIPYSLVDSKYNINDIYSLFCFFRNDYELRVQVNGTRFHQGKLIISWIPMMQMAKEKTDYSLTAMVASPNVIVDANVNDVQVLHIPFASVFTYCSTRYSSNNPIFNIGRILVKVLSPLTYAEGASDVQVKLWMHSPNPEMRMPSYRRAFAQFGESLQEIASGAEKIVAGGAQVLNVLPGIFSADKPVDATPRDQLIPRVMSTLCHGSGVDSSSRLSLVPGAFTIPNPVEDNSVLGDEMDLHFLKKVPSLLTQFKWTKSDSYGKSLWSHNLEPMVPSKVLFPEVESVPIIIRGVQGDMPPDNMDVYVGKYQPGVAEIHPTMLGYISAPFVYWRGSLIFHVQIIATQFHSGRLAFCFQPNESASTVDAHLLLNNPLSVLDIQEAHELDICVPYDTMTPWLQNSRSFQESTSFSLGNSLGTLHCFVVNELAKPNNVSEEVQVNVFIKGGDDFEVAVPRFLPKFQGFAFPKPRDLPPYGEYVDWNLWESASRTWRGDEDWQSTCDGRAVRAQLEEVSQTVSRQSLFNAEASALQHGDAKIGSVFRNTTGESFMDLHTLLKRWYLLFDAAIAIKDYQAGQYFQIFALPVDMMFHYETTTHSLLYWFSKLFQFWKGSLRRRFYFIRDASGVNDFEFVSAVHRPDEFLKSPNWNSYWRDDLEEINYAHEATLCQVAPYIDVEIPYYSRFANLLVDGTDSALDMRSTGSVKLYGISQSSNDKTFHVRTFASIGDDFQFSYLIGPPILYETGAVTEFKTIPDVAKIMSSYDATEYLTCAPWSRFTPPVKAYLDSTGIMANNFYLYSSTRDNVKSVTGKCSPGICNNRCSV